MKRFKLLFFVVCCISAIIIGACGDDDDNPAGPGGDENNNGGSNEAHGTLTATVAGTHELAFNSSVAVALVEASDSLLAISAEVTVGDTKYEIAVTLYTKPAVGQHQITDMVTSLLGHANGIFDVTVGGVSTTYISYAGTLTFTQVGDTYKGTFNFQARENIPGSPEVTITSGVFDVPKTVMEEGF